MKMRYLPIALALVLSPVVAANAQVSVDIGLPGVNIGLNMPMYPQLVQVPGYPVYYDPGASSNYFFYDGAYWVYQRNNWYASTWYNGPWQEVEPESVPLFVLRIPVRYYRQPPTYFRGWSANAAPRWGDHWGQRWSSQHRGWDQWNRNSVPMAAPLPTYQRRYSGARYPHTVSRQTSIRTQNYRYQPRDAVIRQIQRRGSTSSRADAQAEQSRMMQRAQTQQSEHRAQAKQAETVQRVQTRQRAKTQQTERRAQAQQSRTLQRAQKQQRAQTRQTEKHARAQQRAQTQHAEKRAQAQQRAQKQHSEKRAQTQQRAKARHADQHAQAQQAKQQKRQSKRPAKSAPQSKDKEAQVHNHGHGGH